MDTKDKPINPYKPQPMVYICAGLFCFILPKFFLQDN